MGKIEILYEHWLLIEEKKLIELARERLSQGQYFGVKSSELERDLHRISKAFFLAAEGHFGELRDNDDLYITHPIAVARILLEEFTHTTVRQIIGALLHDVKESKKISLERISREFDQGIAKNVDALSKKDLALYLNPVESPFYHTQLIMDTALLAWLKILPYNQEVEIQSFASIYFGKKLRERRDDDTFGNLDLLDDDELAEKLADRIHNLRTLGFCTPKKRGKIIEETKKYFLHVAEKRFPDDGYILLVNEIEKLERKKVRTEVADILEHTQ